MLYDSIPVNSLPLIVSLPILRGNPTLPRDFAENDQISLF